MNLDKCILNTRMQGRRVLGETFKELKAADPSFLMIDTWKHWTVSDALLNQVREFGLRVLCCLM